MGRLSRARTAAAWAALLAWAWWATGVRPFTWPARVALALPSLVVLGAAFRRRGGRPPLRVWLAGWRRLLGAPPPRRPPGLLAGAVVWGALVAAIGAWELAALFGQPRPDHPTLSSISGPVLAVHPARFLVFLLWLALGRDLLRR
jgi:hypothetical protein